MKNRRIKRLIACLIILSVLVTAVTFLTGSAETFPDISKIDQSCYLPYNQQFFHRGNGGYLLASTDNSATTLVSLLDESGNIDYSTGRPTYALNFAYEKAAVSGGYLYFAGPNPNTSHTLQICRFSASDCSRIYNQINNVSFDLNRGFTADEKGNLFLVTVPFGSKLDSASPFWDYTFSAVSGSVCTGFPLPDSTPSSSEIPSSSPPQNSSGSSSESSQVSAPVSSQPGEPAIEPYYFSGSVTVESLQKELDTDGRGAKVRVTTANGSPVPAGNVGTGDIIEVLLNGKTDSRVMAVVSGDLTGAGTVTEQDNRILYEHVTNQKGLDGLYLQAADVNKNGKVDTSDMLRIKSMVK